MRWLTGAAVAVALALAGCGDEDEGSSGGGAKERLVVSAAASMTEPLTDCSRDFEGSRVRLSFAGSDELAAQIRQGVEPDVYAAANTKLPAALYREHRLSRPVEFTTNELVLAVPENTAVRSLDDLTNEDVTLAIGSESVPVGSYTREVLSRLPEDESEAILDNVRSNEPDVKGVVGKLTQGAADAGFVYRSDVKATKGKLEAIELRAKLRPEVTYAAGVVRDAEQPELARGYIEGLASGGCQDALRRAGFGPPPE